jgi:hypothetical protein
LIKKSLFITIAALILIAAAIVFVFFKKTDDGIFSKVPSNAKSVLIIDAGQISKKLFLDDLGKEDKSRLELLKSIPDSLSDIDFAKSGLELLEKLAVFTLEDLSENTVSVHFIIKINDDKLFDDFIKMLCLKFNSSIEKVDNFNMAFSDTFGLLLAWDKHYLAGTRTFNNTSSQIQLLKYILSTEKEHSIISLAQFASVLKNSYDVLFYSIPYERCPFNDLRDLNHNIEQMVSFIEFNDGEIDIKTIINPKHESTLEEIFPKTNDKFYQLYNTDSSVINLNLNLNVNAYPRFLKTNSDRLFRKCIIPYLKSWNGKLNLTYTGTKVVENEFIGYDFDDDFNKIEIKKTKHEKIPDIKAIVGFNKSKFDSVMQTNRPVRDKMDTLLFAGGNYLLRKVNDKLLIYSKQSLKPSFIQNHINNNIYLHIDYQKLNHILIESGFETENNWYSNLSISTIDISVSKSATIDMKSKIGFKDREKNSLFSLIEILSKKFQ